MKRFIVFLLLVVGITATSIAQNPWSGFWKPVTSDKVMMSGLATGTGINVWKFRPTVNIVAQKYTFTGDDKVFNVGTLNAAGVGITYEHFIDVDGAPYNNFGVTAALLISHDINSEVPVSPCPFIGITALQYISIGGGYDFGVKKAFLAMSISYSFN